MSSVVGCVSTPVTELAIVICRPSRIHAAPSPQTIRVWNGDHRNRSRRAGIVDRIGTVIAAVALTPRPPRDAGDLEQLDARLRLVTYCTTEVRSATSTNPDDSCDSDDARSDAIAVQSRS
jgi:hypothetical protein